MSYKESESGMARVLLSHVRHHSDLLLIVGYAAVMDAVLIDGGFGGPLGVLLGLPLLAFVPGYGLLAALFPRQYRTIPGERSFAEVGRGALSAFERATLSFGVSVALLPPFALTLELLGVGFGSTTVVAALSVFLFVVVVFALIRRLRVPESERFTGSLLDWGTRLSATLSFESRLDAVLTVVLVVAALVATSAVGVGIVAPSDGETFTNVALLTEDATGNLTTANPESNLTIGEPQSYVVAVENHEDRTVGYTLVGEIQRVDRTDGRVDVTQEREFLRRSDTLASNESWHANMSVTPRTTGDDLRITYLLYRGDPPNNPNQANAYRYVHVWIDVSDTPA
ncbi:DUF1616 domain-containing protein [Halorientalis litorea]|jgi:uncharacterized membrane protein|uniref:DUF1616 domain-containing protein n=1 Tax=Halorientalis litorea TaxID=2931977 RepID=UPI001FF6ED3E|nr:DUF1616 domain-containing protein [Halorientalis litorea]